MTISNREQQRALAQQRRIEMSAASKVSASAQITRHLLASPAYREANTIGAYLALKDEVNLAEFIARAQHDRKEIFVPRVIAGRPHMEFVRLRPDTELQCNRFGIAEPAAGESETVDPQDLEVVLVPLVAFDNAGNRLGMGAGYYDRSFAFRSDPSSSEYPRLFGVAFSCQRVHAIEPREWDVALDYVATENGIEDLQRADRDN